MVKSFKNRERWGVNKFSPNSKFNFSWRKENIFFWYVKKNDPYADKKISRATWKRHDLLLANYNPMNKSVHIENRWNGKNIMNDPGFFYPAGKIWQMGKKISRITLPLWYGLLFITNHNLMNKNLKSECLYFDRRTCIWLRNVCDSKSDFTIPKENLTYYSTNNNPIKTYPKFCAGSFTSFSFFWWYKHQEIFRSKQRQNTRVVKKRI